MSDFRKAIFDLLAGGQDLFGTIYLIAPRLEAFGFKMPTVDRWTEEDMITIRHYVERKGIKNLDAEIKKGIENRR